MVLENMAVCDLRCVKDVCIAERIEEIRNIGLLILPSEGSGEVKKVLENIKRTNVASEIQAAENERKFWCILRGYAEFGLKSWNLKNKSGTNSF